MHKYIRTIAAAAVLACASAPAMAAEITWRVPTSVPEGSAFYKNYLERFADNVKTLTSGRVEIQPFGAGVIVPALKVYEAVQDGVVEAGHSTPSYLVNQDPENALFAGLPGGMGPDMHSAWMFEGGGMAHLQKLRDKQGLKSLVIGLGSSEVLAHSNKAIRGPEDLKGLKYRTSGAWGEVMRDYFGAVPTVVPPGDTYTLLQRKGVDAVEWGTPWSNTEESYHQAAKYIILPGVHQPTFMWEVVIKQDRWDKLPADLKPLLEAAARLTAYQSLTKFYDADMKAMEHYRQGKNEIITLSPEFVKQLGDAGRDWLVKKAESEKAKGNTDMAVVAKEYLDYRARWLAQNDYLYGDN